MKWVYGIFCRLIYFVSLFLLLPAVSEKGKGVRMIFCSHCVYFCLCKTLSISRIFCCVFPFVFPRTRTGRLINIFENNENTKLLPTHAFHSTHCVRTAITIMWHGVHTEEYLMDLDTHTVDSILLKFQLIFLLSSISLASRPTYMHSDYTRVKVKQKENKNRFKMN